MTIGTMVTHHLLPIIGDLGGAPLQLGNGKVDDIGYDGLVVETDDEDGYGYGDRWKQHAERRFLNRNCRS